MALDIEKLKANLSANGIRVIKEAAEKADENKDGSIDGNEVSIFDKAAPFPPDRYGCSR